jgi:hypothetical protein
MFDSRRVPTSAGALLLLACTGAQTRSPVVTISGNGRMVSPSSDAATHHGAALVRFVNAVPGREGLNILIEDRDLFGPVTYRTVSRYVEVEGPARHFSLRSAPSAQPLADGREAIREGVRYTILALSDREGVTRLRLLHDDLLPAAGKARLRVIHAAPGIETIDLAIVGTVTPLVGRIGFDQAPAFRDIDPTTAMLEVRSSPGTGRGLRLAPMRLEAGRSYSVVVTGTAPAMLQAMTFEDEVTPAPAPVASRVALGVM